jgi:saccharopine dehydrogenase-like NADP-dependent oxidoreductase
MFALLGFTSEETVAQTVRKTEKVTWKDVLIAQLPNVDPKLPEDQLAKKINDSLLNVYSESLPSETNAYLQPLVNQERETAEQDVETFIRCIKELGLWEEEVKDPEEKVIDALCRELEEKLSYMPNERDMIFMLHEFVIKHRNETTKKIKASLCVYGNQNSSATSLTVGLPVAIASVMTLKGQIKGPGLVGPNEKALYENVLKELEKEGIIIAETTE